VDVGLNEGTNYIVLELLDLVGNERTYRLQVFLDTESPVITIVGPAANQTRTNVPEVVVSGTVTDIMARLTVGGKDVDVGADGKFQSTVTLASDGPADIVVMAVDSVGNTASTTVHVDLLKELPMLKVEYLPAVVTVEASDNSLVIKGLTSPGLTMVEIVQTSGGTTVTDRYSPIGPDGSFTIVRRLTEGVNVIKLRVANDHGSVNETQPYTVTYKYVAPGHAVAVEETQISLVDMAIVIAAFSIALVVAIILLSRGFAKRNK
jgi:hypothetical protein